MADGGKPIGWKSWSLEPQQELRLDVAGDKEPCVIRLDDGAAEVFGAELAPGRTHVVRRGRSVSIFTWHGAKVSTAGEFRDAYVSEDSVVPTYAHVHQRLEARRREAASGRQRGPRVFVVGPTDAGKSTLARMLVSWAARMGWSPLLVDLDPGQQDVTLPGAIGAVPVDRSGILADEEDWPSGAVSFWLGTTSPSESLELFKHSCGRLGEACLSRALRSAETDSEAGRTAGASGMVVNTMGWVDVGSGGYEALLHSIRSFAADVVLVLGHDKVHAALSRDLAEIPASAMAAPLPHGCTVVKLPRSGGVVERGPAIRRDSRAARIRRYFYGPVDGSLSEAAELAASTAGLSDLAPPPPHPAASVRLSPTARTLHLTGDEAVHLVSIIGAVTAEAHLPIGATSALETIRAEPVDSYEEKELIGRLLGISWAQKPEDAPHAAIAGFLHIAKVDEAKKTITVLAPSPQDLPSNVLILSSVTWREI